MVSSTLQYWAATDVGGHRSNNEDAFLCLAPATGADCHLWVVCDGMGGESAGELASASVGQAIADVYPAALQAQGNALDALREALTAANRRILYMQRENPALQRMGTTAAAVAYHDGRLWVASVGDSRVYLWDGHTLRRLTRDQTKYEKMREMGVIGPDDDQPNHPAHNVLVSVLGREAMTIDTCDASGISPDEAVLLVCSDGVSNVVDEATMAAALDQLSARDACEALLSIAFPVSRDNITAQVIRFPAPPVDGPSLETFLARNGVLRLVSLPDALQSMSFTDPRTRWATHQSGQHTLVAPRQRGDAPDTGASLTPAMGVAAIMTGEASSDASSDASSEASPEAPAPAPARPSPTRARRLIAPKLTTSVFRVLTGASDDDDEMPARKPWTQRPSWVFAIALLSTCLAFLAVWGVRHNQRSSALPAVEDPTEPSRPVAVRPDAPPVDADNAVVLDAPIVFERAPLRDFVFPSVPRAPDVVHAADGMPAYLVVNGALTMDAHEVTIAQYRDKLMVSNELQILHRAVDVARYAGLPCSSGVSSDWNDGREPVCVSAESAAVYCEQVGRRLPAREDWRAFGARDNQLIAPGYGKLFRYGSDGPPPAIPTEISGLYGVLDGVPEYLQSTPREVLLGDVVTLGQSSKSSGLVTVHAGLQRQWNDDTVALQLTPMMGFRCVSGDVPDVQAVAAAPRRRAPRASTPEFTTPAVPAGSRIGHIELRELPEDYDTRYQRGTAESSRFHSYILETFVRKRDRY